MISLNKNISVSKSSNIDISNKPTESSRLSALDKSIASSPSPKLTAPVQTASMKEPGLYCICSSKNTLLNTVENLRQAIKQEQPCPGIDLDNFKQKMEATLEQAEKQINNEHYPSKLLDAIADYGLLAPNSLSPKTNIFKKDFSPKSHFHLVRPSKPGLYQLPQQDPLHKLNLLENNSKALNRLNSSINLLQQIKHTSAGIHQDFDRAHSQHLLTLHGRKAWIEYLMGDSQCLTTLNHALNISNSYLDNVSQHKDIGDIVVELLAMKATFTIDPYIEKESGCNKSGIAQRPAREEARTTLLRAIEILDAMGCKFSYEELSKEPWAFSPKVTPVDVTRYFKKLDLMLKYNYLAKQEKISICHRRPKLFPYLDIAAFYIHKIYKPTYTDPSISDTILIPRFQGAIAYLMSEIALRRPELDGDLLANSDIREARRMIHLEGSRELARILSEPSEYQLKTWILVINFEDPLPLEYTATGPLCNQLFQQTTQEASKDYHSMPLNLLYCFLYNLAPPVLAFTNDRAIKHPPLAAF